MVDEGFDELARSLREGVGRELRQEAAEDELLTELQRRRHRRLEDVARSAMHRGDQVAVEVGGLTFRCPVRGVGADYVALETDEGGLDVRLDAAVIRVVERTSGGHSGSPLTAETLRGRLGELEQQAAEVEIVTTAGLRVRGRIEVMAADHLMLSEDDGIAAYVPIELVAIVFSRIPARRI